MNSRAFILFFMLLVGNSLFSQSKKELFTNGYNLLLNEQYLSAIEYFNAVLKMDNEYGHAYYNRGVAYLSLKDFENALKDFSWVINNSENDNMRYLAYGNNASIYHLKLVDLDKALMNSEKALAMDSTLASGLYMHGLILQDLEEFEKAIIYYDKSIAADPADPDPFYNRAIAKRKLGLLAEAVKDYDQVIKLDPKYVKAFNNRGYVKTLMEDYAGAITDFDKAIKLKLSTNSYNNRGFAKLKLGDLKGAKDDCEWALQLDGKNSWAYHYLGLVWYEMGKSDKACKNFRKAVEFGKIEVEKDIKEKCGE